MPNYYNTLVDYQKYCYFGGELEQRLNAMFHPNPWIFESAYQPEAEKQRFIIRFRNFDGSQHYMVEYNSSLQGGPYRFP